MPTILRHGQYRFFFYAGDGGEPHHIHVEHDQATAKFWLNPVRLQSGRGFSRHELREIEAIIKNSHDLFVGAWNDYFGS